MTVRRLGLYNSQANASHSIAQVNDPFLVSVVATNTIEEPALIRVWVVPSLATQESQYSYITYDIELDPGNTLETHRFAINSLDTVRVRANKTGISFSCSGIPQTGPIPADEVQTLTNKTISGLNNTLTDIANSSLVNDSITLMGEEIELGEVVANLDYFQFDTAATPSAAVGRMSWNDGEGTANITLKGGNISLPIGQEEVVLCYNGSGLPLTKGTVVYINGAQGQRPRITKASASGESTSSKTLGMVSESITIGGEGFVTTFGVLKGINTITYAEGAALWLSTTAGEVTTTMPTAPNHAVFIGYCVRSHATSGQIFIKVQNGYELEELHNVLITSPIGGQGLVYDAYDSLWKNQNVDALPSQTGNSGKYLTTNGTVASWGTIDLSTKANLASPSFTGTVVIPVSTNTQTSSYTLVLSDASKLIEMNVGSANTITVPPNSSVAFPIGTKIDILQVGLGETSFVAGSEVTINSDSGKLKINAQWAEATLIKRAENTWALIGALKA